MKVFRLLNAVGLALALRLTATPSVDGASSSQLSHRRLAGGNSGCGSARVRKPWDALSSQEQALYVEALGLAIQNGVVAEFSAMHLETMGETQAHHSCAFFAWHRRMLLAFESYLRDLDSKYACLTIPYYDVHSAYVNAANKKCKNMYDCSPIFKAIGGVAQSTSTKTLYFDGQATSGYPVKGAPFKTNCDDNRQSCGTMLRNNLQKRNVPSGAGFSTFLDIVTRSEDYASFLEGVQFGIHNEVHNAVGGAMATFASPRDVFFYSWHSAIDMYLTVFHACQIGGGGAITGVLSEEQLKASLQAFTKATQTCGGVSGVGADTEIAMNLQVNGQWVDATQHPTLGKYFAHVGDKMWQYGDTTRLDDYSYSYELPSIIKTQVLGNAAICKGLLAAITPAPTPSPTVEKDREAEATPAPSANATSAPPETVTPAPSETVTSAPSETVTPAPSETVTPAPSETVTPAPSETVTPAPSETVTPAPSDSVTPAPSETVTPAPSETVAPAPSETVTPAPSETVTPAPSETVTPAPSETVTPAPSETVTPAPSETVTLAPSDSVTPTPSDTVTPAPSETVTPAPSETVAPAPSETVTPAPSETVTPAPSETVTPAPSETVTPAPSETVTLAPSDSVTPTPSDTVTPAPSETVTPAPSETVAPAPSETVTPAPSETVTPAPSETVTPTPTSSTESRDTDQQTVAPAPSSETVAPVPSVTPSVTVTVTAAPTSTESVPESQTPEPSLTLPITNVPVTTQPVVTEPTPTQPQEQESPAPTKSPNTETPVASSSAPTPALTTLAPSVAPSPPTPCPNSPHVAPVQTTKKPTTKKPAVTKKPTPKPTPKPKPTPTPKKKPYHAPTPKPTPKKYHPRGLEDGDDAYWAWVHTTFNGLMVRFDNDLELVAQQMRVIECLTFDNAFGVVDFSADFVKNFHLATDKPACGQKIEAVASGNVTVAVASAPVDFQPEQVEFAEPEVLEAVKQEAADIKAEAAQGQPTSPPPPQIDAAYVATAQQALQQAETARHRQHHQHCE